MRIQSRNGSCRYRADGSSKPWTARASKWAPARYPSAASQHCRDLDGKRGHRSGTIGDAPAVLMVIQFDGAPVPSIALRIPVTRWMDSRFASRVLPTTSWPMRRSNSSPAAFAGSKGWSGWAMPAVCCSRTCRATVRCDGSRMQECPSIAPRRATPTARPATFRDGLISMLAPRALPVPHRTGWQHHPAGRSPWRAAAQFAQ